MKKFLCDFSRSTRGIIFSIGAIGYWIIEILWRGYSHWTMMLAGGICFSIYYKVCKDGERMPFFVKCMLGAFLITAVELMFGTVVNVLLSWNIWDYTHMPFHFFGQICLPFFLLWFLLCIPLTFLCNGIREKIEGKTG